MAYYQCPACAAVTQPTVDVGFTTEGVPATLLRLGYRTCRNCLRYVKPIALPSTFAQPVE